MGSGRLSTATLGLLFYPPTGHVIHLKLAYLLTVRVLDYQAFCVVILFHCGRLDACGSREALELNINNQFHTRTINFDASDHSSI